METGFDIFAEALRKGCIVDKAFGDGDAVDPVGAGCVED
jgi:hypothetical protein